MTKDLIYMVTPSEQTVTAGSILPLTTISRRYGCSLQSAGNLIVINKPGYYFVTANATFTGEAGDAQIEMQKSGVLIPGMRAAITISTADTNVKTLTMTGIVRVMCCEKGVPITLVNTGTTDITTSNISVSVSSYA